MMARAKRYDDSIRHQGYNHKKRINWQTKKEAS